MSMTLVTCSLDGNLAVALGIWPGCVNHMCCPGKVVLSGLRT